MRKFAECWPDFEVVQQVVAQIPWRTNRMLLDKLDSEESRIWYAHKTIENGWSSNMLELQIQGTLMERSGRSTNNFPGITSARGFRYGQRSVQRFLFV